MKTKYQLLALLIIVLLLVIPIASSNQINSKDIERDSNQGIISFNSYISIFLNHSVLNDNLPIDYSTHVPMDIVYGTDIPEHFLWFLPRIIRNLWLFSWFFKPLQNIYLQVSEVPKNVDVYITNPEIPVDIPFGSDRIDFPTYMVITPRVNALSKVHQLKLNAYCEDIGRLKGFERIENVQFTVEYYPYIQINAPQNTVCPQNQWTIIPINITNHGNWLTRVTGQIIEFPQDVTTVLNPPFIDIDISETKQFFLEVYPGNFIGEKVIPLEFTAYRQPLWADSPIVNYTYFIAFEVI